MPPFPERESSILAKLKKKKGPSTMTGLEDSKRERGADVNGGPEPAPASAVVGPSLLLGPCTSSCGAQSLRFGTSRAFAHGELLVFVECKVCATCLALAVPEAFTCPSVQPVGTVLTQTYRVIS